MQSNRTRSPLGYDETIRRATGLIVAGLHHNGGSESEIRAKVDEAVKEALEGDKEWQRPVDLGQGETDVALSTAGIFRFVLASLDIDRHDQRAQESFFEAVRRAVDPALTDALFGIER